MAEHSTIEWTDHTFNPWWGCTKVSPACDHCYAEVWAKRTGLGVWGARAPRRFLSDVTWERPLHWNHAAARSGRRMRVFCASMADVFEWGHGLGAVRDRLWTLIERTPHLDWLVLTKRPHLVRRLAPWTGRWPEHVWLGTTAENQRFAAKRIPFLLDIPCRVRFLSCEPLLGPGSRLVRMDRRIALGHRRRRERRRGSPDAAGLDSRAARSVHRRGGLAFHFKQWGVWRPRETGGDGAAVSFVRMTKKRAGRTLDGRIWNELPDGRSG